MTKGDIFTLLTGEFTGDVLSNRGQLVTATAVSRNSIDLLAAKDIGPGTKVRLIVNTLISPISAGATTVNFEIIQADDAALTSNVIVIGQSGPIAKADLVVSSAVQGVLPATGVPPTGPIPVVVEANVIMPGQPSLGRRFLGARFTIATGPFTNIEPNRQFEAAMKLDTATEPKTYPSGFTVALG